MHSQQYRFVRHLPTLLSSALLAGLLTACGGGGGGSTPTTTPSAAVTQGAQADADAVASPGDAWATPPAAAPATPASGTATPMTRPDVAVATMDEIAAWNQQCQTARCMIFLPERSGRSLTWWGTDPRELERVNASCTPQTSCRIPDGDLLVWNFQCAPQPTCRVALSRPY